jgi:putative transposase
MGRVGACADNAAMDVLQPAAEDRLGPAALGHRQRLRPATLTWIEKTYHRRRRQDRLGRLTPTEFETLLRVAHAA